MTAGADVEETNLWDLSWSQSFASELLGSSTLSILLRLFFRNLESGSEFLAMGELQQHGLP